MMCITSTLKNHTSLKTDDYNRKNRQLLHKTRLCFCFVLFFLGIGDGTQDLTLAILARQAGYHWAKSPAQGFVFNAKAGKTNKQTTTKNVRVSYMSGSIYPWNIIKFSKTNKNMSIDACWNPSSRSQKGWHNYLKKTLDFPQMKIFSPFSLLLYFIHAQNAYISNLQVYLSQHVI